MQDVKFCEYIEQKESEYEENCIEIPPETLMTLAENKYKIRMVQGTWNARTPEEEKIIALKAYIKKVESGASQTKTDKKKPPKEKETKRGKQEPEPWMTVPPKTGEPNEKKREGKTWHWCPNHAKWTIHKAEDCKGIGGKFAKTVERKARLARAVEAVNESSDSESEDE